MLQSGEELFVYSYNIIAFRNLPRVLTAQQTRRRSKRIISHLV